MATDNETTTPIIEFLHEHAPALAERLTRERVDMLAIVKRLQTENAELLACCEEVMANGEEDIPEDVADRMRTAIGNARGKVIPRRPARGEDMVA